MCLGVRAAWGSSPSCTLGPGPKGRSRSMGDGEPPPEVPSSGAHPGNFLEQERPPQPVASSPRCPRGPSGGLIRGGPAWSSLWRPCKPDLMEPWLPGVKGDPRRGQAQEAPGGCSQSQADPIQSLGHLLPTRPSPHPTACRICSSIPPPSLE